VNWADRGIKALEMMETPKMSVDYAEGADQAAVMIGKRHYHGAILDKNMPGLDGKHSTRAGIDLFEYILEKHADTSCLLLTSDPTFHSYQEAEELGMFAYRDKDEVGHREVAQLISEMFKTRLATVFTTGGIPIQADRMYFFGKKGKVIKQTTADVHRDRAGVVEIDGEKWRATTKGRTGASVFPGSEVRAYGILYGAIQVDSGQY
jgi:CheY-like chemotaxis protein